MKKTRLFSCIKPVSRFNPHSVHTVILVSPFRIKPEPGAIIFICLLFHSEIGSGDEACSSLY